MRRQARWLVLTAGIRAAVRDRKEMQALRAMNRRTVRASLRFAASAGRHPPERGDGLTLARLKLCAVGGRSTAGSIPRTLRKKQTRDNTFDLREKPAKAEPVSGSYGDPDRIRTPHNPLERARTLVTLAPGPIAAYTTALPSSFPGEMLEWSRADSQR